MINNNKNKAKPPPTRLRNIMIKTKLSTMITLLNMFKKRLIPSPIL